jgi:RNA recognition motif-containing protein
VQHYNKVSTQSFKTHHHLFVKEDKNSENTVFIVNLPTDTTSKHLDLLFKDCGNLLSVKLSGNECGGSCHVTFQDQVSVELVLKLKELNWPILPSVMDGNCN